jgi:hypothetical protein
LAGGDVARTLDKRPHDRIAIVGAAAHSGNGWRQPPHWSGDRGLEEAFRSVSVPADAADLPPAAVASPAPAMLAAAERAFADRGVTFVGPPLPALLAREDDRT